MARKYTIWKALIQNLNRSRNLRSGFTLLELIVGLLILSIVSGLALNAFINASKDFNQDKKTIDASQNLSAILEIIGNDIKQAGEQINDSNFPVVEFSVDSSSSATPPSSKITIRRSVWINPLTLCQDIAANVATLPTTLVVADTASTNTNCSNAVTPLAPATPTPILPVFLRAIRNYRCQLDNPDSNYATTTVDLCVTIKPTLPSSDKEKVRAAISDGAGHIRMFDYTDDNIVTANTKFSISVGNDDGGNSTMLNDARNKASTYNTGSPIYLIEERVYTLGNDGNLKLSIDGGTPTTLIKNIAKFTISARVYTNTTASPLSNKTVDTTPSNPCVAGTNTQFSSNAGYTCKFNSYANSSDIADNWKTLAGIKVELQAKYDATGRSATASTTDEEKLTARAEFFPRNVLSK